MITDKTTGLLNDQINAELYSAYLYLAMSSDAGFKGWPGAGNWFFVQAQEEMTHAQRLYNYVNSVGRKVVLAAIEQPPSEFESLTAMFRAALNHERKVTAMINHLVDAAVDDHDHATQAFLQWFVTEQVEEEKNAGDVLAKVDLAGEDRAGTFMVDTELAARMFTPPADLAQT
jgi:ferritin